MGVCVSANGSKIDFNMSYGAFHNLRRNIAELLDPKVGELYHQLASIFMEDRIAADKELQEILSDDEKYPDDKVSGVIEFLFASDIEGSINYKACKQIYDLIKDVDFEDKGFQYVSYRTTGTSDYELFKIFLRECYKYHRNMRWI